ncbi:MAG TPA: hypothetical protein VLK36_05220 [Gaiellaceae bacterium]|nr:hypothetical protein [Gaiellaceae bacterium]
MVRKVAAGLVGLGLVSGAGKVAYDKNGGATVKITDSKTGQVQSVHITGDGKSFSCPAGTRAKLEPGVVELGRIELTLQKVRGQEAAIHRRYPGRVAPHAVIVRYNGLVRREGRLVAAYNANVDEHNAVIDRTCHAN